MFSITGIIFATICIGEVTDLFVRPRTSRGRWYRSSATLPLRAGMSAALTGCALLLCGTTECALPLSCGAMLAVTIGSNLKYATLGEPLIFSDVVVARSFVLYPRFYLDAVPPFLRAILVILAFPAVFLLVRESRLHLTMRLTGLALAAGGLAASLLWARLLIRRGLMTNPDTDHDVSRHGLVPVLIIYWLRWRASRPLPPVPPVERVPGASTPDILIIVQCESFADVMHGTHSLPDPVLPGLIMSRQTALAWGDLLVSGFGAYTMRTEYGVLCGREETELGFRRFDPFLTARDDTTCALPHRLANLFPRAVFVHPHDLRFYNRDALMPSLGFTSVIGEEQFAGAPHDGPYVSDAALGDRLAGIISEATEPTLIYAVTMENHGPWAAGRAGQEDALAAWTHHVQTGDRLLVSLNKTLEARKQNALLVFFGDHRPSVPGQIMPGREKHTPFIIKRFSSTGTQSHTLATPCAYTPAGLHRLIVRILSDQNGKSGSTLR